MDKREIKTLDKIYSAFESLLLSNNYDDITIQDILDKSTVSRSTFYSHFKNKEEILLSFVKHIFSHVFDKNLIKESNHDYSKSSDIDYAHYLAHMLDHFYEDKLLIKAILSSSASSIFLNEFEHNLRNMQSIFVDNKFLKDNNIPRDLNVEMITGEFIYLFKYWIMSNNEYSRDEILKYFIEHNTSFTPNKFQIKKGNK